MKFNYSYNNKTDDLEWNFNVYNDENRCQTPWVPSTLLTIDENKCFIYT